MIEKPNKVHYDTKQRISTLYFENQAFGQQMMRGGVCWPVMVEIDGKKDVRGFILMAGIDVDSGMVTIFEQTPFIVIDNILTPEKVIEYHGIASWFNMCWTRYFAQDFFWNQDFELSKKYRLEIIRSESINPKPQIIEIGWSDIEEARQVIWKRVKLGKIRIEQDSQLMKELELTKIGDKQSYPSVHALMCCLCGIERYPWRKRI